MRRRSSSSSKFERKPFTHNLKEIGPPELHFAGGPFQFMLKNFLAVVLAVLLFAVPASASGTTTQWMVGNEAGILKDGVNVYPLLQKANVGHVRLAINWPKVNPAPGVYDWTQTDIEINSILAAGMVPYANFTWAPRHASGGIPAYEEYTRGCTVFDGDTTVTFLIGDGHPPQPDRSKSLDKRWARRDVYIVPRGGTITIAAPGVLANDGDYGKNARGDALASVVKTVTQPTPTAHGTFTLWHNGSLTYTHNGDDATEDGFRYWVWGLGNGAHGIHYAADDYDYCVNVPRIDPNATYEFVKAFVERYRDKVYLYGMWNEPGLSIYWPPMHDLQDIEFERYAEDLMVPFVDAVRTYDPDPSTKIIGPECDSSHCIRGVLEQERKRGVHWFDIVSFHPYPWSFDFEAVGGSDDAKWADAAMYRIDNDFKPAMDPFLRGRTVWATEIGHDSEVVMVDVLSKVLQRPWIKMFNVHDARFFFKPGSVDAGTNLPSALYEFTADHPYVPPVRRRSVRVPERPIRDKQE